MEKSLFFEVSKKANEFYLRSFVNIPMNIQNDYFTFLTDKGIDKLNDHQIIELAKKTGVLINYEFSYYKTHVGIFANGNIYMCEQHSFIIARCIKTLFFLNIIN
jgi:hypothetical protein